MAHHRDAAERRWQLASGRPAQADGLHGAAEERVAGPLLGRLVKHPRRQRFDGGTHRLDADRDDQGGDEDDPSHRAVTTGHGSRADRGQSMARPVQTLNLKTSTSPSATTYSLPSIR